MMKVAIVHDQLNEFGGAERVLAALAEMYPTAPIYTAYYKAGSAAYERFKNRKIVASWAQKIPFFDKLVSPLRFLAPLIWESFNFNGYDLVISSASWYITKGILTRPETLHICYVHTPPRYLWGLETSVDFNKNFFTRIYARLVNPYLQKYDYCAAQRSDVLIANSENTRARIKKFYKRDAVVIYPPVELLKEVTQGSNPSFSQVARPTCVNPQLCDSTSLNDRPINSSDELNSELTGDQFLRKKDSSPCFVSKRTYFLIVSRIVGGKGLELAVRACTELNLPLKVVGQKAGWSREYQKLKIIAGPSVEFLGAVSDEELIRLYSGAKAFLAVARDEDFGITPVEAMACGTPVIAYKGGGYLETVVPGKTGIFFEEYSAEGLKKSIERLQTTDYRLLTSEIQKWARKFSKERFVETMQKVIRKELGNLGKLGKLGKLDQRKL